MDPTPDPPAEPPDQPVLTFDPLEVIGATTSDDPTEDPWQP